MVTAEQLSGVSLRDAMKLVEAELTAADCPDPDVDARELVRLTTGRDPLVSEQIVQPAPAARLAHLTQRRAERYPLQYLEGSWPFLDFELAVGEGVLIPRADTEVVCESAAEMLAHRADPCVLDLCAGSGCLGLGIRRLVPYATVTALEKSPQALPWLLKNAAEALAPFGESGLAVQVDAGDVFTYQQQLAPESLDLIVSNPPYLTAEEMTVLQPEVRFEPAMALDGGEDGGNFYRHIVNAYAPALKPGGWLVLEIGCGQQTLLRQLIEESGQYDTVDCRRDYGGNDRVILARKRLNG